MVDQLNETMNVQFSFGRQQEITEVRQAISFLTDWSSHRQGAHLFAALDACVAAQLGRGHVSDAENAFRLFAEHVGIIAYQEASQLEVDRQPLRRQALDLLFCPDECGCHLNALGYGADLSKSVLASSSALSLHGTSTCFMPR